MSQIHISPRDLPPELLQKIWEQAENYLNVLASHPLNSPGFQDNLSLLERLGSGLDDDVNWVLNNKPQALTSLEDPATQTRDALQSLTMLVKTLSPKPTFKLANFLLGKPQSIDYNKYFTKYETSQDEINQVIKGLLHSRDSLLKENGRLKQEEQRLYELLNKINEYQIFVDVLNTKLDEQLETITNNTRQAYRTEVLFVINQKKQDLLTLYNVVSQAYLSLKLTRKNNEETRRNLDNTRTMTVTALQTAQQVGFALTKQKNFLDNIDSLNHDAEETMKTLKDLQKNGTNDSYMEDAVALQNLEGTFYKLEKFLSTLSNNPSQQEGTQK